MLIGRIDELTLRPRLDGLLSLPNLAIIAEPISFLVDTGATNCLLGPADIARLAPDLTVLQRRDTVWAMSGPEECLITEGYVFFEDDSGTMHAYEIPRFFVTERALPGASDGAALRSPPSLLGMEILRHWRTRLSVAEGIVEFDVLHADVSYPRAAPPT